MSFDPSKIWDTIKSLNGRNPGCIRNEVLIHNGKHYSSSRAKANVFVARYAEISRPQIAKSDRRKKAIRKALGADSVAEDSCNKFNLSELKAAIDRMKAKGATGRYNISPILDRVRTRFYDCHSSSATPLRASCFPYSTGTARL